MSARLVSPVRAQLVAYAVLWALMGVALAILFLILGFVLWHGLPRLSLAFLTQAPADNGRAGGILPIIVGTLQVTLLGVGVAAPLGIGTAIYLSEYTREGALTRAIRFGSECLAGVPSVIFGLFGLVLFVTTLGFGWCILSGGLTLGLMTLPVVIRTSEEALRAVPSAQREVSLSLGANKWQTVLRVVLPSALPGIATGLILALGRAVGETAAVIFTAGSSLPHGAKGSLLTGTRTLAVHFYQLAREGISSEHAYASAAVLVLSITVINVGASLALARFVRRHR